MTTVRKYLPEIIQAVGITAYFALGVTGETLQVLAASDAMDYSWAVGHLSDIGAAGAFVSMRIFMQPDPFKKIRDALLVPVGLSLLEVVPLFLEDAGTVCDPQDLLCYWGGAALAYFTKEASERLISEKETGLEEQLG